MDGGANQGEGPHSGGGGRVLSTPGNGRPRASDRSWPVRCSGPLRLDALADPGDTRGVARSADLCRAPRSGPDPTSAGAPPRPAPSAILPVLHAERCAECARAEAPARILCPCLCGGRAASCAVRNPTSRAIFAIPRQSPDFLRHPQVPPRSPQRDPQFTHRFGVAWAVAVGPPVSGRGPFAPRSPICPQDEEQSLL